MDLEYLDSADKVFDALGGNPGVSEVTASKASTVSNWRTAGSFPSKTYVKMTRALQAVGKTAPPSLWKMGEDA